MMSSSVHAGTKCTATMASTKTKSEVTKTIESSSIHGLLKTYCRERLYVHPLHWTERHLELLCCRFVDKGPMEAPSQSWSLPTRPKQDHTIISSSHSCAQPTCRHHKNDKHGKRAPKETKPEEPRGSKVSRWFALSPYPQDREHALWEIMDVYEYAR